MYAFQKKLSRYRGFRKQEIRILNKPVFQNPYFPRKKQNFIVRHLGNRRRLAKIFIILGLLYGLFYSNIFMIQTIDISGHQELKEERLREEIEKTLHKKRWGIFPLKNYWIYSPKRSIEHLFNTFVLETVSIKKHFPRRIAVDLKEKIPNLTYSIGKSFYYLDLEGVITTEVSKESIQPSFPRVEDPNERIVAIKEQVIPKSVVQTILTLNKDFAGATNTKIEKFLLPQASCPQEKLKEEKPDFKIPNDESKSEKKTERRMEQKTCSVISLMNDVTIKTEEGWEARFTTNEKIQFQLERLKLYLLKKIPRKEDRKNLIYIDLRFGEKIYVKER